MNIAAPEVQEALKKNASGNWRYRGEIQASN